MLFGSSSKLRSSSGTCTRGRKALRSWPALAIGRSDEREAVGNDMVDDEAYGDATSRRRWKRLGIELREERALLIRDGRRARGAAPPAPSLSDGPASERSRCAARAVRGLNRCDMGRGEVDGAGRSSATVSLLLLGGCSGFSEGAHDVGRIRSRFGGREPDEPLELPWPMVGMGSRPALESGERE